MTGWPLERLGAALLGLCALVCLWAAAFPEAGPRTLGQLIAEALWLAAIIVFSAGATWCLMLAIYSR
jgi:hypothetical protein